MMMTLSVRPRPRSSFRIPTNVANVYPSGEGAPESKSKTSQITRSSVSVIPLNGVYATMGPSGRARWGKMGLERHCGEGDGSVSQSVTSIVVGAMWSGLKSERLDWT